LFTQIGELDDLVMTHKNDQDKQLLFVVNSQQEFWRREYGGKIFEKNESYQEVLSGLISLGHTPIFQVDDNFSELDFLETLPPDSIIAWCHADERYDLSFNKRLSEISAVRLVLRPYRISNFTLKKLFRSFSQTAINLKYAKNLSFALKIILWQFRGLAMLFRQLRVKRYYDKNQKEYLNILIGYTNIFAVSLVETLTSESTSANSSLFALISRTDLQFGQTKVTFAGQVGQVVRETSIRSLSYIPEAVVVCRNSYGASNVLDSEVRKRGVEYISSLKSSRFVLCPPGNISGESFRIFETVLMRRIPLAMANVTSDPSFEVPFKYYGNWQSRRDWGHFVKEALITESKLLTDIATNNFVFYTTSLKETRTLLQKVSYSIQVNSIE
jgi:hypothetical protein